MNINYEDDIVEMYLTELRAVENQEQLDRFVEGWKEMVGNDHIDYAGLKAAEKLAQKEIEKDDYQRNVRFFNILAPPKLLWIEVVAKEYGVPTGVVWKQMKMKIRDDKAGERENDEN